MNTQRSIRRLFMRLNENTTIGELLDAAPEAKDILANMGMHCSSCPTARRESLAQAAEVHGMDIDDLLEDLKGFLEG
jgi:hybrid cluster-associated redox disulfide protein